MKIQAIYLNKVGPINNQKFDFYDDWNDKIFSRVLFSGPNGSGKSLIFKTIAEMWEAIGYWLDNREKLLNKNTFKKWLQQWGGIAIILTELPDVSTPVGILFGNKAWFKEIEAQHPFIPWIGEVITEKKNDLLLPYKFKWFNNWSEARKKLMVSFDSANTPNMIYLDAEECRWVSPNRRVGKMLPEDSSLRWLFKYQASEDWQGQLEASLINLKVIELHKYHDVIRHLNRCLYGKEISHEVKQLEGKNRIQVNIHQKRGQSHTLDMLSSGERQILLKLYLVSRWLEPGGLVMIDEPDHYLHPSIVPGFLAQLEALVEEKKGQLLIASHSPDVWNRYETRDKRIKLGNNL